MTMHTIKDLYAGILAKIDGFAKGGRDFDRAKMVLPFVYYILFYIAFSHLEGTDYLMANGASQFVPKFPLLWLSSFDFPSVVLIVYALFVISAFVACVFPYSRPVRLAAFLGFFEFHAFNSSFGNVNHQWDHWLWVLAVLAFLPTLTREPSAEVRRTFSLGFWGAQAILLLTYTMAGIGKLVYIVVQFFEGQTTALAPDAAALFAATQLNLMHESVPLGAFIIAHPYVGWIPFLMVLEVQTFALIAAFRPELHRLWGFGLVLFHVSTYFAMRAVFTAPSALLLVLLVASPFAPEEWFGKQTWRSIPLIGPLFSFAEDRLRSRSST